MYQDAIFLVLLWMWLRGIEQWNKPGCLGFVGDYTTELNRDYDKPLEGSILNNQYIGKQEKYKSFFFVARLCKTYRTYLKHVSLALWQTFQTWHPATFTSHQWTKIHRAGGPVRLSRSKTPGKWFFSRIYFYQARRSHFRRNATWYCWWFVQNSGEFHQLRGGNGSFYPMIYTGF